MLPLLFVIFFVLLCLIFPLGSFLIDPFLLIVIGVVISRIQKAIATKGVSILLSIITLTIFYAVSVSLYFNLPWVEWFWKLMGYDSGCSFMWNSWIFNLPYNSPTDVPYHLNIAAAIMYILYILWLYLGIKLGYALFKK